MSSMTITGQKKYCGWDVNLRKWNYEVRELTPKDIQMT